MPDRTRTEDCEHSKVCGRDALDGHDGKCILHSEKSDKDEEAFKKAFEEHREEHGPDFRQMVFSSKIDFSEETFEERAYFHESTFEEVNFREATFKEADFRNATFEEAHFSKATFERAIFWEATFQEAVFQEADFRGATFEDATFMDATFQEANFYYSTFEWANFRGATFNGRASFLRAFEPSEEIRLEKADFSSSEFGGDGLFAGESAANRAFAGGEVDFRYATVAPDASLHFRYADLSHCRFLRTNLRDVEFIGVKWCREFTVGDWLGDWLSIDWFRGKGTFDRIGLYDEVVESRKRRSFGDTLRATIERMGSSDGPHWTLFEVEEESKERDKGRWREVERLYRQLKRNHEERGDFPRGGLSHRGEGGPPKKLQDVLADEVPTVRVPCPQQVRRASPASGGLARRVNLWIRLILPGGHDVRQLRASVLFGGDHPQS